MVLRRAASTAACFLIHRALAFGSTGGRSFFQAAVWRRQTLSRTSPQPPKHQPHQQLHPKGRAATSMASGGDASSYGSRVFAFDFDGVICNSQGESSRSGFKAVERIWPEIVEQLRTKDGGQQGDDAPSWMVDRMRELRPIVETGYENILLVRLLIEERMGLPTLYSSEDLFEIWGPDARDALASRYGMDREELVDAFGSTRDKWIETDFESWLGANTFYEGVPEAISSCEGEVYVITTKQTRFASALLDHAGVEVPQDRIFGLGTGPKPGVLAQLLSKHSGATIFFFEDRVEALEAVCNDDRLKDVQLYLCEWGFNTAAQRARGEANERVNLIGTGEIGGILAPGDPAATEKRP